MATSPSSDAKTVPRAVAVRAAVLPGLDGIRLSDVLGQIYEAALEPSAWVTCLESIRDQLAANYVSLIVRPGSGDDLGLIVSAAGESHTIDPHSPPLTLSPFSGLAPDRLVTVDDVLTTTDWRASTYYRDWCAPHGVFHVLAVDIQTRDGGVYGLRITRDEASPAFSGEDRARCELLLPHLRRALNLYLSVNRDSKVNSLYSEAMAHLMVGVIVLDEQARVLESNAMAKAIIAMADGLRIHDNQLEATYGADNRKLQRLIREVLDSAGKPKRLRPVDALSVSRPSGKVSWGLVVQQMAPDQWTEGKHRPSAAVFVRDTDSKSSPPLRVAQELFQLTAAESMLAIQLANGLSLEEAAEALNIRRNTARAHLRSIFSKTGVRRQTELVRLFLNSVALLGTND